MSDDKSLIHYTMSDAQTTKAMAYALKDMVCATCHESVDATPFDKLKYFENGDHSKFPPRKCLAGPSDCVYVLRDLDVMLQLPPSMSNPLTIAGRLSGKWHVKTSRRPR